ncbi:MAG: hypothetical protein ACOCTT_04330 [archaeon]
MEVTPEQIKKTKELYAEHNEAQKKAKQMYNRLRKIGKEKMIERANKEGEMEEIRLYDCLEEASSLGWGSPAGEAIAEEYPKMKELYDKQKRLSNEIEELVSGEMGINPFKVQLDDIIKVAEAVFEAREK